MFRLLLAVLLIFILSVNACLAFSGQGAMDGANIGATIGLYTGIAYGLITFPYPSHAGLEAMGYVFLLILYDFSTAVYGLGAGMLIGGTVGYVVTDENYQSQSSTPAKTTR